MGTLMFWTKDATINPGDFYSTYAKFCLLHDLSFLLILKAMSYVICNLSFLIKQIAGVNKINHRKLYLPMYTLRSVYVCMD